KYSGKLSIIELPKQNPATPIFAIKFLSVLLLFSFITSCNVTLGSYPILVNNSTRPRNEISSCLKVKLPCFFKKSTRDLVIAESSLYTFSNNQIHELQ